jgi:hypothetical protein
VLVMDGVQLLGVSAGENDRPSAAPKLRDHEAAGVARCAVDGNASIGRHGRRSHGHRFRVRAGGGCPSRFGVRRRSVDGTSAEVTGQCRSPAARAPLCRVSVPLRSGSAGLRTGSISTTRPSPTAPRRFDARPRWSRHSPQPAHPNSKTRAPIPPSPGHEGGHRKVFLLGTGDQVGRKEADQQEGDPDCADPDRGPHHPGQVGGGGPTILRRGPVVRLRRRCRDPRRRHLIGCTSCVRHSEGAGQADGSGSRPESIHV